MKYQVSFTLKNGPNIGVEFFKTKKAANQWVKTNSDKLYWHQLTETNPSSKYPKQVITFDLTEKFIKKTGTLKTYYETGMECLGLVFYEDGLHGPPNPDFDPSKPEDKQNFKNFATYDALTFIGHGHILELDGLKIGMIKDRDFGSKDGYRLSFYPKGFSKKELLKLFVPETTKAYLWLPKKV